MCVCVSIHREGYLLVSTFKEAKAGVVYPDNLLEYQLSFILKVTGFPFLPHVESRLFFLPDSFRSRQRVNCRHLPDSGLCKPKLLEEMALQRGRGGEHPGEPFSKPEGTLRFHRPGDPKHFLMVPQECGQSGSEREDPAPKAPSLCVWRQGVTMQFRLASSSL